MTISGTLQVLIEDFLSIHSLGIFSRLFMEYKDVRAADRAKLQIKVPISPP